MLLVFLSIPAGTLSTHRHRLGCRLLGSCSGAIPVNFHSCATCRGSLSKCWGALLTCAAGPLAAVGTWQVARAAPTEGGWNFVIDRPAPLGVDPRRRRERVPLVSLQQANAQGQRRLRLRVRYCCQAAAAAALVRRVSASGLLTAFLLTAEASGVFLMLLGTFRSSGDQGR